LQKKNFEKCNSEVRAPKNYWLPKPKFVKVTKFPLQTFVVAFFTFSVLPNILFRLKKEIKHEAAKLNSARQNLYFSPTF
jgi:hypothetical protein